MQRSTNALRYLASSTKASKLHQHSSTLPLSSHTITLTQSYRYTAVLNSNTRSYSNMSKTFPTTLSKLLPTIKVPVVSAAMAGAAGGLLAGEVTKAGGFGFIGAGYFSAKQVKDELAVAAKIVGDLGTGKLEVGIGFLGWYLSSLDGHKEVIQSYNGGEIAFEKYPKAIAILNEALNAKVRAIWVAFGTPREMSFWTKFMREREGSINPGGGKALLVTVVGNVDQAKEAVEDLGVDMIVVQGNEAGGHGLGSSPNRDDLISQIQSLLPTLTPAPPSTKLPQILAAGGLANGSDLASALQKGCSGAIFGTRFLLTPESSYSDSNKSVLLATKSSGTIRSMAFDEARNGLHWPEGVDGRGVISETVRDYDAGVEDVKGRQERYQRAVQEKDKERVIVWAGTGIGRVNEIKAAGEVVREITEEARKALADIGQ